MNRRGFLGSILAAGAAPWIAKAGVLMPVRPLIWTPLDGQLFFDTRMDAYDNLRGSFAKGTVLMRAENGQWRPAHGNPAGPIAIWDGERVVTSGVVSVNAGWTVPTSEHHFV